jgi:hypothetical protein
MNDSYMQDDQPTTKPRRRPQLAAAVGLLLAGGLAGGVLAATNSASATDTPSATSAAVTPTPGDRQGGQRDGETLLTGTNAATARAAALKAVPGGTIDRLETDADGAVYEAHMTKADGTRVTVKLDKNFKATATEEGMGRGGPGDHRGSTTTTSGTSI